MDIDPTPWAAWLAVLTPLAGCVLFVWRAALRLLRRLDAQDATLAAQDEALDDIRAALTTNFGPNSGGLREAVNGISARLNDHIALHSQQQNWR